jgi:hypothetical protein
MAVKQQKPRRIVDPRGHRVPVFIRLCEAFVDNLSQILRLGLIVGGIVLVQELLVLRELLDEPEIADHVEAAEGPALPTEVPDSPEPLLTDEIIHAQNCTRKEYWSAHYDECFPEGSEVYPRPNTADPDDTGFLLHDSPVLFAGLEPN